jgi:adenine-specific DNA-methyltransferase
VKTYSKEYDYPITTPSGRVVNPPRGRAWATSRENFKKWREDNRIWFGKDGKNVPSVKIYLSEVQEGVVPLTIWLRSEVGDNELARKEIKEIFPDVALPFETPKPTSLINRILQLATYKDSIILDSFAGSGTTAHAVLKLNKEDGGNRKFVLVETEDYADKITAERVRRVIKGVKGAKDENLQKGLGGMFSYFELGKPIDMQRILKGKDLPSFVEMARYIFYTATGEEFNEKKINEKIGLIGESKEYQIYLLYKPEMEYLKSTALTLERAEALGKFAGKKRLVFGPAKYLDQEHLERLHIDFAQLPFEIYQKQ